MARQIAFGVCTIVAALATMFVGIGLLQLAAIWEGAYDPIRDDGRPPGSMPQYYTHIVTVMIASVVIAVVSARLAVGLRKAEMVSGTDSR
jgi:hypothetical protein